MVEIQPTAQSVRISSADGPSFRAKLFSPDGRLVSTRSSEKGNAAILPHPARSGVYLLRVETADRAMSRRVVVP